MSTPEIIATITELQEYTRIIEEAKAAAERLKKAIQTVMGDEETLIVGPYKVTWTPYTRTDIDSKALRADHPELAAEYTRTTTARRFTVH